MCVREITCVYILVCMCACMYICVRMCLYICVCAVNVFVCYECKCSVCVCICVYVNPPGPWSRDGAVSSCAASVSRSIRQRESPARAHSVSPPVTSNVNSSGQTPPFGSAALRETTWGTEWLYCCWLWRRRLCLPR